jgi:hypothetical protein
MAAGDYESALPVSLDAVQQGQVLFKPAPALQLFPLYLLAAQVRNVVCKSSVLLFYYLCFTVVWAMLPNTAKHVGELGPEAVQAVRGLSGPRLMADYEGASHDKQPHEVAIEPAVWSAVCLPGVPLS